MVRREACAFENAGPVVLLLMGCGLCLSVLVIHAARRIARRLPNMANGFVTHIAGGLFPRKHAPLRISVAMMPAGASCAPSSWRVIPCVLIPMACTSGAKKRSLRRTSITLCPRPTAAATRPTTCKVCAIRVTHAKPNNKPASGGGVGGKNLHGPELIDRCASLIREAAGFAVFAGFGA